MNGNPDGLRCLAKYSKLPVERIDYRPEADKAILGQIERGLLFFMAFWSGPSFQAFAELTKALGRLDPSGRVVSGR